jgi:hypothetical protein
MLLPDKHTNVAGNETLSISTDPDPTLVGSVILGSDARRGMIESLSLRREQQLSSTKAIEQHLPLQVSYRKWRKQASAMGVPERSTMYTWDGLDQGARDVVLAKQILTHRARCEDDRPSYPIQNHRWLPIEEVKILAALPLYFLRVPDPRGSLYPHYDFLDVKSAYESLRTVINYVREQLKTERIRTGYPKVPLPLGLYTLDIAARVVGALLAPCEPLPLLNIKKGLRSDRSTR